MFDPSAPHIIILLVVVLLLFGSTRLPGAAKALGESMRIFKSEAKKMHDDDPAKTTQANAVQQPVAPPPLPSQPAVPDATQQQLQDMQRQLQELQELQRQAAAGDATGANGAPLSEAQRNQQPS
jgi:sec-independent protein translocase protein TatA